MLLKSVNLFGFRNLQQAAFETDNSVNIFYGENGSGKTSILESLFYLGRAKSFRTSKRNNLINAKLSSLAISAELSQAKFTHKAGISLSKKGESKIKIDGEVVTRLSELSNLFPAQVITPESFDEFFSSPKARRSYMDFGLFHVEQEYQNLWSSYVKLQKQTNALLRHGGSNQRELVYWYRNLIEAGTKIETLRETFFEKHLSRVISVLTDLFKDGSRGQLMDGLVIRYKKKSFASNEDDSSDNAILKQIEKDQKYKQVGFGPTRADLAFVLDGEDVTNRLSRGQSKMLYYLLEVAMVRVIKEVADKNLLLLVDDLPSEVDDKTRNTMLELLLQSQAQIFVTGIEPKIAMEFKKYTESVKVFHVEHGTIRPINMEQLCP